MPKETSRNLIIQKNNVTIAGVKSKGWKWQGEPIDVTDDDLSGVRELLSTLGGESIEFSVEGFANTTTLRDVAATRATSKMLTDMSIERVGGTFSLTGNFLMTNYEEKADTKGAIEFSCTFISSGNWTYVS